MPKGASTCDFSFRYWRQWTWDGEWAYFFVNNKQEWAKRGQWTCNNYGWKQQKSDMANVPGGAHADCYTDAEVNNVPCKAGSKLKVGFASSIDQHENDESWGFSDFKMTIKGVQGDLAGVTVHHFNTKHEGTFAPNGKSDNFEWGADAKQDETFDCAAENGTTYVHKAYGSYDNLHERCRTNLPIRHVVDERVSLDRIIAWWKMETFDEKKWEWESVVEHHDTGEMWLVDFVEKGDLEVAMGGEGAHDEYRSLQGNTDQNTKISWGNIVAGTMTLCTTSMYTPGGRMGRVFRGGRSNWLHGHWNGWARSVHYDGWNVYPHWSPAGRHNSRDWVVLCATAQGDKTLFVNRYDWNENWKVDDPTDVSQIDDHNYQQVYDNRWNQRELIVGRGGRSANGCCTREESGFRVSEVIAWNRGMARAELHIMMRYLMERLRGEAN
jgi:hypothetical protein